MRLSTLFLAALLALPLQMSSADVFARDVVADPGDGPAAKKAAILALRQAREDAKKARVSTSKSGTRAGDGDVAQGGGHGGVVGIGGGGGVNPIGGASPAKINLATELKAPGGGGSIGSGPNDGGGGIGGIPLTP